MKWCCLYSVVNHSSKQLCFNALFGLFCEIICLRIALRNVVYYANAKVLH